MMTREQIAAIVRDSLVELFEIEPSRVLPEARFDDDLEIDSIDAVDLIVQLKPLAGRRLEPEAFKAVRTVGDVVDALHDLLNNPTPA
jgi:acyl carrier protein